MKLSLLESIDTSDLRLPNTPMSSMSEKAWVDGKEFSGSKEHVKVEVPEGEMAGWILHTHPSKDPSPLMTLPSKQDIETAIEIFNAGRAHGMGIFNGPYYLIMVPSRESLSTNTSAYERAAEEAWEKKDINIALEKLKSMGFDVEIKEKHK